MPTTSVTTTTASVQDAEELVNKWSVTGSRVVCCLCILHQMFSPQTRQCSRALSNRVSVYAKRLVGEQDTFAVEVSLICGLVIARISLLK